MVSQSRERKPVVLPPAPGDPAAMPAWTHRQLLEVVRLLNELLQRVKDLEERVP